MTLWQQLTDVQREQLVHAIIPAIAVSDVPEHLRPGLVRYFSDGILPGSFLQAVLVNDLMQAARRADPESGAGLVPLVDFLVTHAPSTAWGSREAVLAWTTTPERLEV